MNALFVNCRTIALLLASFSETSFFASSSKFSTGSIWFTSPRSFASVALIISPVIKSSNAFLLKINLGKIAAAIGGNTPTLISGCPNLDFSEAITISQNVATSQPPPSATPFTSATVGALIIVGVVILYIYVLYLVERNISRQQYKKLIRNLDKIKNDKA